MKKIYKKLIVCLSIVILMSANVFAQTNPVDVDSLYAQARKLYKQGELTIALEKLNEGLLVAPTYTEVRQFRVRLLQQLGTLEKAADDIFILLKTENSEDTKKLVYRQVTLIDDVQMLKDFSQQTDVYVANDPTFSLLKAEQFITLNDTASAKEIARNIMKFNDLNSDQKYRLQLLIKKTHLNLLGVNHEIISFLKDNPVQKSWNTTSVQYQHFFSHTAVIARVNYSQRFFSDGALYELEAYPVFSKKWYGFVNVNASSADFFQNFGVSASSFHGLGKGFEVEVGFRYADFDTNSFFSTVVGITKYTGRFYLNGRAFLGPEIGNTFIQNYQLNVRYYLENPEDYLFARIGYGISPDDRSRFTQIAANPDLTAKFASLGFQKTINKFGFQLSASYLTEDLSNNRNGNQIGTSLGVSYRF